MKITPYMRSRPIFAAAMIFIFLAAFGVLTGEPVPAAICLLAGCVCLAVAVLT